MNEMAHRRSLVMEVSPFLGSNHSLGSRVIKRELEGERRLDPSPRESRIRAKRAERARRQCEQTKIQTQEDKRILEDVRRAIIQGDYGKFSPQDIGQKMAYLLDRGYSSDDITTTLVVDLPLLPATSGI